MQQLEVRIEDLDAEIRYEDDGVSNYRVAVYNRDGSLRNTGHTFETLAEARDFANAVVFGIRIAVGSSSAAYVAGEGY